VNKRSIATLIALGACTVSAEELPKWELGIGIGSQTLADYRGSEEYATYFVPIPYIAYRGEFLQADDDGIRGLLFNNDRFELDISLAGALNGDSDDNRLREGMPELHPSGEIGPSANFNLSGSDFSEGWSFRLPLRAVYILDPDEWEVDNIGYLFNPQFTYEDLDWKGWDGSLDIGALWGSNKYHDYYYSVAPRYATETRPAYEADSGYSGSYLSLSANKREGDVWIGGYLRYDNLSGATFEHSPLMETDHYFTLALGISWILSRSKQTVVVAD